MFRRAASAAVTLLFFAGTPIVLDRTLAIVGHRVITLSEAKTQATITSILDRKRTPDPEASPDEIEGALQTLVRQALIDHYLDNLGLVSEIPVDRVNRVNEELRNNPGAKGLPDAMVGRLLKSRVRTEIFLERHLPFRITVTEGEALAHYQTEKNRRFLGKPYRSIAAIVRADLAKEKTQKEFEKWLETETKRTEVVYLR
ncbi:MAG: hypothetical protein V1495_09100 [Pseudomonadota bacterium]